MTGFIKLVSTVCISLLLAACTIGNGRICGPQTPAVYCDREAYERLMHPKGYGEYWVKEGVTVESWRQDWIACGGRANGDYSISTPQRSNDTIITAALEKKVNELKSCMSSKGYHFSGWRK
jgi:hypothetical protein